MDPFLLITRCRPALAGRRRAAGFTLVELLVTLVIAGVVLTIAVPATTAFLAEQSAAGVADELAGTFRFARTEAIKRSQAVTVCASDDGETCGNDWKAGWVVTVGGTVVRAQNALSSLDSASADEDEVTFASNGLATAGSGTFTFVPVGGDTSKQRNVVLSVQGKVEISKGAL